MHKYLSDYYCQGDYDHLCSLVVELGMELPYEYLNGWYTIIIIIITLQLSSEEEQFKFLPPDEEPVIPKKQRKRAKKAIKHIAATLTTKEEEEEETPGCCERLKCCRRKAREKLIEEEEEEITPSTELTPEMQKASSQGLNMIKEIIFPSLPAVLQDLWVYLELAISIIAFAFGLVDIFPIEDSFAFNYSYLTLATISLILALIDGFIYFFQLGSCARGIRSCRERFGKKSQGEDDLEEEEEEDDEENRPRKCCRMNKKWKDTFITWFELGRNLLTELLLYPLLMFDMVDFITDDGYDLSGSTAVGRTDFSLFVIGGFYLILSVYIMRIFMVAGSMISMIRIPTNKATKGDNSDTILLIKFCAHVLGQIIVHLMVVLVIGAKINNENRSVTANSTNSSSSDDDTNASPFLITAMVLGWIIPLAGVVVFFVVNYYWMKEFSIGFWLNMISLLQGESFAEAVFGGEGLSSTKDKALDFVEKTQYMKVKKQLKRFKAPSVWTKIFFPVRVPVTALSGLLYDIALLAFIACLMLTYKNGKVEFAVFTDDIIMTVAFMISVTTIIIANIHVLILLNLVLLLFMLFISLAVAIVAFVSPFILLVYFPLVACLGYFMICYEGGSALKKQRQPKDDINGQLNGDSVKKSDLSHKQSNLDGIVLENIDSIFSDNVLKKSELGIKEDSVDSKCESIV